jgi:hypothetical protein
MNELTIKQTQLDIRTPSCPISLNWKDNPDIQKLLDVISEIIANEYIEVAKKNIDVFSERGQK